MVLPAYHQEHMIMSKNSKENPNPRKQFIIDIILVFIQSHQEMGREMLPMLDANEEMGSASKGITSIAHECSLCDLLATIHPDKPQPVTFNRGSKTIDYILGSKQCADAVVQAGVLPFYHRRIQADHRALYVDFDTTVLLGGNQLEVAAAKNRMFLSMQHSTDCQKYLQAVKAYWRNHNIHERVGKLHEEMQSIGGAAVKIEWERIDIDIGRAMKMGEKALKRTTGKYAWSMALRKALYARKYWKKRLKLC